MEGAVERAVVLQWRRMCGPAGHGRQDVFYTKELCVLLPAAAAIASADGLSPGATCSSSMFTSLVLSQCSSQGSNYINFLWEWGGGGGKRMRDS
jgi:hypothetical protein